MELKLDKTTKILLGAIALGLFLNASNVFIDKAYANTVQKVVICNEGGAICATINGGHKNTYGLVTYPSLPIDYDLIDEGRHKAEVYSDRKK